MNLTPDRKARFKSVAANRQTGLAVVLENVHDPHNIGAVLRTCDSVGVSDVFVIYTDPQLQDVGLQIGKKSASGARKWLNIHFYTDLKPAMNVIRANYNHIYATHLHERAMTVYEADLSQSVALLFGNEHDGLSSAIQGFADGNVYIPQVGMVRSLNISVACAVCLYEAFRQRHQQGLYDRPFQADIPAHQSLYDQYVEIHRRRWSQRLRSEEE